MSYSFTVANRLRAFDNILYQIIVIKIKVSSDKFLHTSQEPFITVINGTIETKSFLRELSGNENELLGYFTTDAFDLFTGLSTITFGSGHFVFDAFENIDINGVITPLDSVLASLNAPLGDNVWLNS